VGIYQLATIDLPVANAVMERSGLTYLDASNRRGGAPFSASLNNGSPAHVARLGQWEGEKEREPFGDADI